MDGAPLLVRVAQEGAPGRARLRVDLSGRKAGEPGALRAAQTHLERAFGVDHDLRPFYRAFDDDTQPRGKIELNGSPYFVKAGKPVPVGSVTFVRQ